MKTDRKKTTVQKNNKIYIEHNKSFIENNQSLY
jgi:hypothetical protein